MEYERFLAQIFPVVVLFGCGEGILDSVRALAENGLHHIVLVDNSGSEQALCAVKSSGLDLDIHVIHNTENLGIACALNQGWRYALASGAGWVLTMDQDSRLCPDALKRMFEAFCALPDSEWVGCIAAMPEYDNTPTVNTNAPLLIKKRSVITSGSLVRLEACQAAGGFDEKLFIDCVDFDFCLRLEYAGYSTYLCPRAQMRHELGVMTKSRLLGIPISIHLHSPLRNYYIYRNSLYLIRTYWKKYPVYIAKFILALGLFLFQCRFLEGQRAENEAMLRMAVRDFRRGKYGRYESEVL